MRATFTLAVLAAHEQLDRIPVTVTGRVAETIEAIASVGNLLCVEGRIIARPKDELSSGCGTTPDIEVHGLSVHLLSWAPAEVALA